MRAIGTIANDHDAQRFVNHLLASGIVSQADPRPDGFCIWVRDEDKVEPARHELSAFLQDPTSQRYEHAAESAALVRRREAEAEKLYRRNVRDMRTLWSRPNPKGCPLTIGLIAACLLVAVPSRGGREIEGLLGYLFMTRINVSDEDHVAYDPTLPEIRKGEAWRLVTPIFIHFGEFHLFFNMWWLYNLGGVIEIQRGKWRLALLVLVAAVISNLTQNHFESPFFGGMSGVVYALLGYAWMKTRFDSASGVYLTPDTVTMMIAWLFLCMVPGFPINVANHAHVAGLVVGIVVGYAPVFWRRLRRR